MNNYEFCADFARRTAEGRADFRVLDYGCGAGQIIKLMIDDGLDAWGCETFYEGGDVSGNVPSEIRDRIHVMRDDRIPFPDGSFDLVLNNQVLEHVADLDMALSEIRRVLKPGGICLSLFPHREVWREGHCNIPLLHRFPKGRLRVYYAAALYPLGYFKNGKSPMQWARNFAEWIDRWCYYRSYHEIAEAFTRHLSAPTHIESEWIVSRRPVFRLVPKLIRRMIAYKMAGLVFVTKRQVTLAS